MDDGEEEVSDQIKPSNQCDLSDDFHGSTSMDTFLDDFLKNTQTCTHTHTCNPPGPDAVHTHTCYHTHTQVFTSDEDDGMGDRQHGASKSRRPSGNREAVRKYREKKKAHTAYLEEEVKKLRVVNQQLIRRLQGHAMLEAELSRLRALLLDVRGKIDVEFGVFPFNKQSSTNFQEADCRIQSICETSVPCLHPHVGLSSQAGISGSTKTTINTWEGSCEPVSVTCQTTPNGAVGKILASVEANREGFLPSSMDTNGKLTPSAVQTEEQARMVSLEA